MRNPTATGRASRARPDRDPIRTRWRAVCAALTLFAAASPAAAQDVPDGTGIKVGETRVYPEIRLDYFAYDNVYGSGTDRTEGSAVQLSPLVRWRAERRLLRLEASYDGRYSTGSEEILEFAEHQLGVSVDAEPRSRLALDGYARVNRRGEDRRLIEPRADGVVRERVDIDRIAVGGGLVYGARDARGNLRLGLAVDGYETDVDQTRFALRRREFLRVEPSVRFSLRISPDTRWLLETSFADVDYRNGSGGGDSRVSLLTGLDFAASGAFGGNFRVGVTRISYDQGELREDNTARVGAALFYVPTTFSRFSLDLGRDFDPRLGGTNLGVATAITTSARLGWRYAYSERVNHRASLYVEDNETDCPLVGNREVDVGFELNLRVRRWIELGASVDHQIDRLGECASAEFVVDPDLLETDATRIGVHLRAIL